VFHCDEIYIAFMRRAFVWHTDWLLRQRDLLFREPMAHHSTEAFEHRHLRPVSGWLNLRSVHFCHSYILFRKCHVGFPSKRVFRGKSVGFSGIAIYQGFVSDTQGPSLLLFGMFQSPPHDLRRNNLGLTLGKQNETQYQHPRPRNKAIQ